MFCPICGKQNNDASKFCMGCGAQLVPENNGINTASQSDDDINMMKDGEWYYIFSEERKGPVSYDIMAEIIQNKTVTRDTLVWKNGMDNWIPARQTVLSSLFESVVPDVPDEAVDNRFVWALATVPLLSTWLLGAVINAMDISIESIFFTGVAIFLNIIFIYLDIQAVKKSGKNPEGWLWLGIVLVPVYLFVRASKTDKKYGYAITWCIIYVVDLIISAAG